MVEQELDNTKSLVWTGIGTLMFVYGSAWFHMNGSDFESLSMYWLILTGIFTLFGHSKKSGHLNPATTLSLIVTKDVEAKDGLIRIGVQVVAALVGALLAIMSGYKDSNDKLQTDNIPYPTIGDGDTYKDIDTNTSMIAILIFSIIANMLPGIGAVAAYRHKFCAVTSAVLFAGCIYLAYSFNSANQSTIYAVNPFEYIFQGLFWKTSDAGKFMEQSFWWFSLLNPIVGQVGGAALAHFVIWKDGAEETKQSAI